MGPPEPARRVTFEPEKGKANANPPRPILKGNDEVFSRLGDSIKNCDDDDEINSVNGIDVEDYVVSGGEDGDDVVGNNNEINKDEINIRSGEINVDAGEI